MVGIVLISHSGGLAEGAAELAGQIAGGARVVPAGGTDDGRLGTSTERIAAAIAAADAGDGVLLIPDLGSSVLSALSLLADLDPRAGREAGPARRRPVHRGCGRRRRRRQRGLDLAAVAHAAEEARDARKL